MRRSKLQLRCEGPSAVVYIQMSDEVWVAMESNQEAESSLSQKATQINHLFVVEYDDLWLYLSANMTI